MASVVAIAEYEPTEDDAVGGLGSMLLALVLLGAWAALFVYLAMTILRAVG